MKLKKKKEMQIIKRFMMKKLIFKNVPINLLIFKWMPKMLLDSLNKHFNKSNNKNSIKIELYNYYKN